MGGGDRDPDPLLDPELCDDLELLDDDLDFLSFSLTTGAAGLTVMGMMSCSFSRLNMILNLSDLGSSAGFGGGAVAVAAGRLMSFSAGLTVNVTSVGGLPVSSCAVFDADFNPSGFSPGFQCVGGGLSDLRVTGALPNMRSFFSAAALRRFSLSSSESDEDMEEDLSRLRCWGGVRLRLESLRLKGLEPRPNPKLPLLTGDMRRRLSEERERLLSSLAGRRSGVRFGERRRSGERFCLCAGWRSEERLR